MRIVYEEPSLLKLLCLFLTAISLVILLSPDSARSQQLVLPDIVESTLGSNATEEVTFTLQNDSGEALEFDFTGYDNEDGSLINEYHIAFEEFQISGQEYVLLDELPVWGEITAILPDFDLRSDGFTIGLTVVLTTEPVFSPEAAVVQIGGFFDAGLTPFVDRFIPWQIDSPLDPVQQPILLNIPQEVDQLYVWLGLNLEEEIEDYVYDGEILIQGITDQPEFVSQLSTASGSIAPGGSQEITAMFDSTELFPGSYERVFSVETEGGRSLIPVLLEVFEDPGILILTEELDFGDISESDSLTLPFSVGNPGNVPLELTGIAVSGDVFSVNLNELTIPAFEADELQITLNGTEVGVFDETLTFATSVPDSPQLEIQLSGEVTATGLISLNVENIELEITEPDQIATFEIEITNQGSADLDYSIPAALQNFAGNTGFHINFDEHISPVFVPLMDSDDDVRRAIRFEKMMESADYFSAESDDSKGSGLAAVDFDRPGLWSSFEGGLVAPVYSRVLPFLISGFLSTVAIEAELISDGPAEAQDLTFLFFKGPATVGNIVFQIGGTDPLTNNYFEWGTGDSTELGTVLSAEVDIDNGQFFEDVTLWVGNNSATTIGQVTAWSGTVVFDNMGINREFIAGADPAAGTIGPGETQTVTFTVDGSDACPLPDANYADFVDISTNDPFQPDSRVVVNLRCNIQSDEGVITSAALTGPADAEINEGESVEVTGRVIGSEIIVDEEPVPALRMWAGTSTEDTDPSDWSESAWTEGAVVEFEDDTVDFIAEIGSELDPGDYFYAVRFTLDGENFVYAGYSEIGGGFWDGEVNVSGELTVIPGSSVPDDEIPLAFALEQNSPNPFNPTTTIQYQLPETAHVRLEVYNMLGSRVATLVNQTQTAGIYAVPFDAIRLSSGLYVYRLTAGSFVSTRNMMLVK